MHDNRIIIDYILTVLTRLDSSPHPNYCFVMLSMSQPVFGTPRFDGERALLSYGLLANWRDIIRELSHENGT